MAPDYVKHLLSSLPYLVYNTNTQLLGAMCLIDKAVGQPDIPGFKSQL